MKPTTLLLAASLLANVALVGVLYTNSSPASGPRSAGEKLSGAGAKSDSAATAGANGSAGGGPAASSPDAARDAALGRAFARFAEKMRAAQAANGGDGKWWRSRSAAGNLSREQMAQARRELADAMVAAFGDDLGIGGIPQGQLAFLSPQKRDALRSVLEDYDELMAKFGAQGGIQLASDKEKLKLLTAERDRDIAAVLSPDELAEYQMRTSPSATTVRNRYGDAITDEDEFKKLYTLQSAFDQKFPADSLAGRVTPDQMKARNDASLQLQSDMRAAVGDDAYAVLKRASDSDLKTVDALVTRLNLPADTTDRVAAERDSYSAESQRIMADTSTPFPQRRDQLQALATRAKADLTSTLGAEAADAYSQRSQWINMLQSGLGFSTTPSANSPGVFAPGNGAGPAVYPVLPAGANGARQAVSFVNASSSSAGPSAGQLFIGGGGGGTPNVATQVYSITSTATSTADGHPAGDSPMIIAAPASGSAAAPSSPATIVTPPKP